MMLVNLDSEGRLRVRKSLDLQISSLPGLLKNRIDVFLNYATCFHEIVHDKWRLH